MSKQLEKDDHTKEEECQRWISAFKKSKKDYEK